MATERLSGDERRRQIARAALLVLALDGTRELTAARLAREVGLSDGALFRHFASMQEIVQAAIAHFEQTLFERFPPNHPEPMRRLEQFFVDRLGLVFQQPHIMQLAFNDRLAEAAGDAGEQAVRSAVTRSMDFIKGCVVAAQNRGEIAADLSPDVLTWMVTGAIRGAALARARPGVRRRRPQPAAIWSEVERVLRQDRSGSP